MNALFSKLTGLGWVVLGLVVDFTFRFNVFLLPSKVVVCQNLSQSVSAPEFFRKRYPVGMNDYYYATSDNTGGALLVSYIEILRTYLRYETLQNY